MPFPTYTISTEVGGDLREGALHSEIEAAGPYDANFLGLTADPGGDSVTALFDGPVSGANEATIDGVLAAHDHDLETAKQAKIDAIDGKTSSMIGDGFTYNSKTFSLSLSAQSKMTAAHQIKDHPAFVYPLKWNTKDDKDAEVIGDGVDQVADAAALDGFYLTAIGTIRAYLDSGTALKDAVRTATTIAELDAVVDPR